MDKQYSELYKKVVNLQHKAYDVLDQPQASEAQSLRVEIQKLVDEMEMSKSPRSLETRIRSIQNMLHHIRQQGVVISTPDVDFLHHNFEHLIGELRRLPNY